jgi:hypothetical protein
MTCSENEKMTLKAKMKLDRNSHCPISLVPGDVGNVKRITEGKNLPTSNGKVREGAVDAAAIGVNDGA